MATLLHSGDPSPTICVTVLICFGWLSSERVLRSANPALGTTCITLAAVEGDVWVGT